MLKRTSHAFGCKIDFLRLYINEKRLQLQPFFVDIKGYYPT